MKKENIQERKEKRKEQDKRLNKNMKKIKHKLMIISGKGGVGKTTVAVNIAYGLALKDRKVGILDIDLHGPNVVKMLGIEKEKLTSSDMRIEPVKVLSNLKAVSAALLLEKEDQPLIWRGPLKMITIKQLLADVNWGILDYLIIDSPPGTGDEPLSIAQLIPDIDGNIIVTTPQDVAVLDSRKGINFSKEVGVPVLGLIENMSGFVCPHCKKEINLFGKNGGKRAAEELKIPFLGSIPIETEIAKSSDSGIPFIKLGKKSETVKIIEKIISKVSENIK